jgi:phospholipid/cholesterol/gamma-HCH transport system ATP-binding protein
MMEAEAIPQSGGRAGVDPVASARVVIEVRGLRKSFGENHVLKGVDLTVREGSTTVILGGSGSGKSVLIKHIIGLLRPDDGEVVIEGERFDNLPEKERQRVRAKFGMVFQNAALFDSLTCGENVAFPLRQRTKLKEGEIQRVVHKKLEAVGLKQVVDQMPAEISGGMRKRVGLARALALDPKIVLYDEPTTGLDPITTNNVDDMVVNAARQFHVTSLVISHDVGSAFRIADHMAVLYDGRIVADGTPQEVRRSQHPFVREFFSVWFGKA